ncbi:MAG: fimbrillin family protein, partial [Alistipes sp.]|nr:fimbrillin family protein [Alistipes sp.]
MKKKLLFGLCCAAMAIGCTTDPYQQDIPTVEGTPRIEISGRISQDYATRVDDGGFCQNDQIGLYGVNYTEGNTAAGTLLDEGNQVDNARYTYDEANSQWVSSGNIYYKDVNTNIDLYAYYPYAAVESVTEYKFEVAQDQSGANSVDGYAMSDFLWAKAENITPTENKIALHFYHRMACANVTLKEGQGFESGEFDALNKVVLAMNTTRTSTIDLSTGVVTPTG